MSKTAKTRSAPCLSRFYRPLGIKAVVAAIAAGSTTSTATSIGRTYPTFFQD